MRRAALAAAVWAVAGGVWAREVDSAAAPEPAASAVSAQAGAATLPHRPAAGQSATSRGPKDPMEMLRDRLAEKLGARPELEANHPDVLRVVTKAAGAPATAPTGPGTGTAGPAAHKHALAGSARATSTAPDVAPPAPREWAYTGPSGPDSWGQLRADYAGCASGNRQSPIDIRDGIKVDLEPVAFDYKSSGFSVTDTGRTVQVRVGEGNAIDVMGRHYELTAFEFHRPSEVRVQGRQFDMDVQLIHRDAQGHVAIVAVLLEQGATQPVVQSVWNNLPLERFEPLTAPGALDPSRLLPPARTYYTYMGSMTTPPCAEGVLWMVMKTPVQVSAEQIAIFSRLYPMNARPVQSSAGRLIKESN